MTQALQHDQTSLSLNYRPPALQTFVPLARHLDEIMTMQ
jgi:hypothetical protein